MSLLSPEDVWLEAPDVTASEEHQELAFRIEAALKALVPEPSAVIGATFLVAPEEKPVSADILVAVGSEPGKRPSWRLPRDPVPDVTIEIVSPSAASERDAAAARAAQLERLLREHGISTPD